MPLCRPAPPGLSTRCIRLPWAIKCKKGAPLLDLTIPDWVEAQSEYLLLRETGGTATQTEGILERLRLAGMPEADIRRLIATQKSRLALRSKRPLMA